MSDPVRLRDGGDSFESAVLGSACDDVPGPHVDRKVRAALGLGAAATVGATTSAAAAAGAVKSAGSVAAVAAAKWVGVVVIASVAAGATTAYVSRPSASAVPAPAVMASATVHAPVQLPVPTPARPVVSVEVSAAPVPVAKAPSLPAPPSASSLVAELAPLDAAHAAFDSGDTERALQELNRHDLGFPHGQLAPESLALRTEVYASRHDDAKVLELTARFLARYPEHPQAMRMQGLARVAADRKASVSNP
jgi:hypothetical protein